MTAAWAGALLALGSLSLAGAWGSPLAAAYLVVAAVVPMLACRGAMRVGVSPWASAAATVTLLVLGAYVLAAGAGSSLSETVGDAVPRLLTTPRPLPVRADVLVAPLLLTSLASVLVAIRLGSAHRAVPLVGALVLYAAGALLTAGEGDPRGVLAAVIVGWTLVGWVLLDGDRRTGPRVGAAVAVTAGAAGVLAAATLVPWGAPLDPRSLVDPPTVDVVASSPMPRLGAWAREPERVLAEVTGPVVPLRLVTLDSYDGTTWRAGTTYEPVTEAEATGWPTQAPLDGASTRRAAVEVELVGLDGPWLPSPGRPTAVSADDVLLEPVSGNLYLPGTGPLTYRVEGVVDTPDRTRLASASVPADRALDRYLRLPPLPPELIAYAERTVAGAVTPFDRAVAIEQALAERARLVRSAVSGSQLWRIRTFLLAEPGTPGARRGTAEQFATSFAVLARHNGLPTRVVVGFRPGAATTEGSPVGWTVRGRDATAWPEVYFEDLGWVPFSPTDPDRARGAGRGDEVVDRGGDVGPGTGSDPDAPADRKGGDAEPTAAPTTGERSWGPVAGAVGGGTTVGLLLLLLLARGVRSWRHRRGGAAGAWAETRDLLHLAGVRSPSHHTADDVARTARGRLGTDAVEALALEAQRAAYGPDRPGEKATADLGPLVRAVRRSARGSVPVWRRWWWPFDPSVFLRSG